MRYLPLVVILASQAARATCGGPQGQLDNGLVTKIISLLLLFAAIGPVVGTVLGEIILRLGGRGGNGWRPLLSLVAGGVGFAVIAPALFSSAGTLGFWAPVPAGIFSLVAGFVQAHLSANSIRSEKLDPEIGFENL